MADPAPDPLWDAHVAKIKKLRAEVTALRRRYRAALAREKMLDQLYSKLLRARMR